MNLFFEKKYRIILSLGFLILLFLLISQKDTLDYANISNPDRFIAHAGGKIKNTTYTNTREALDLHYKKGLRLFELDIKESSDGYFLALHDWNTWKRLSGYKGNTPVTREIFLNQPILDDLTPIDMEKINDWFSKHPDAILITDKTNEVRKFSQDFAFPDRLEMEIFTKKAFRESEETNIPIIPSESLLSQITENKIEWMQNNNIKRIALSSDTLRYNREFLTSLKDANIKVYLYELNKETQITENFLIKNEFNLIWGMYSDDITLSELD